MRQTDRQVDRRSFLKAAGGAAAAVSVAGCTSDDPDTTETDPGTGENPGQDTKLLRYARGSDSQTLDPHATDSGEDAKVTNQVYDTLIDFEPGATAITESLATDWNIEGTTATVTLREGVTFHDGESFTAEDVVATFRRFNDKDYEYYLGENVSIYGPYLLDIISDMSASSKYEVTFELNKPYAPFMRNLAVFALGILSKKSIEEGANFAENPVGTGAFSFENWNHGNGTIRLAANEEYWGQVPNVDELVFLEKSNNSTRAQSLDAGEADIVDGLGASQANMVKSFGSAELRRKEGMTVGYMAMNMNREPFQSKKVRQAINYAVDTKNIVENIYRGIAIQAAQPLPPNVMAYNEELDPYPHDPDKAQTLLEEAGYGDGFSFELASMNNPRPYFPSPSSTAEAVRSNLGDVGIDVTINEQGWSAHTTYIGEGKHDACFIGWISDNADPDNFYSPLLHPGVESPDGKDWVEWGTENFNTGNYAAWANEEFMSLVDESKTTYEKQTRVDNYLRTAEIVHEEAPWLFVTHTEVLRGVHNRVENFTTAPIGGPFLNQVDVSNSN